MDQYFVYLLISIFLVFAYLDVDRYNKDLTKIKSFKKYQLVENGAKITTVTEESVESDFFWGIPLFFMFIGWNHPIKRYLVLVEYNYNGKTSQNFSYLPKYMNKLEVEKIEHYLEDHSEQNVYVSPDGKETYLYLNSEEEVIRPWTAGLWILFAGIIAYTFLGNNTKTT